MFLPNIWQLTLDSHVIALISNIVLSTHRNDQSFIIKLKMTSVYRILVQRMCLALWFPVLSQVLATMGQVQFWFINTDCRIMAKLKDTFSTEMGDFKLYSAWHIKAGIIWLRSRWIIIIIQITRLATSQCLLIFLLLSHSILFYFIS